MSLYVIFTGMCAFVKVAKTKVRVVLPNLNEPVGVHGDAVVPGHAAHVRFKAQAPIKPVVAGGRVLRPVTFTTVSAKQPSRQTHVLVLESEVLSIEPDPPMAPEEVDFDRVQIVEMREIVDEHQIDDALVSEDFDPEPSRVAAWFEITRGHLFAPKDALRTLEFRPRKKFNQPYRGEFAEEVIWELPRGNYLLASRSFGSRAAPVDQWKIDASGQGDVYLYIGNLPIEDLTTPEAVRLEARDEELVDHHFHRFYELCARIPEQHPLPYRVSAKSLARRSHGGNCPPAVFDL